MGVFYTLYKHYQITRDTARFQTAFPLSCRLHFLPIRKDAELNTDYNLFIFYS